MIANVNDVVEFLKLNSLEYWRVKSKDTDNAYIFEADENKVFADNVSTFRRVMDVCSGSRFFLQAAPKKGVSRGNFADEFKNISETPGVKEVPGLPQIQGVPQDEVDRRINDAINGLKTSMRMEALEAENKELKQDIKDLQTPINRVITKIEPYIGNLLATVVSKIIPSAPAIQMAGIEHVEDSEQNTEHETQNAEHETQNTEHETENPDQERLMKALEMWAAADPEFIDLIEAVANMAATKDPMYNMAKNMLKK